MAKRQSMSCAAKSLMKNSIILIRKMKKKKQEKKEKYQELGRYIWKIWQTSVNVILRVIGPLRAIANVEEICHCWKRI